MKKGRIKRIMLSFIMAVFVFAGLLAIENKVLQKQPRDTVVQASKDILKGTVLEEGNVKGYFTTVDMEENCIVEGAYSKVEDMVGMIAQRDIASREVISTSNISLEKDLLTDIVEPVEVAIKVADIGQASGGLLRGGDKISVSIINRNTYENEEVLERIYVSKAIHADGSIIPREDLSTSALTITLIMSKEQEMQLNNKLNLGTVRICKILD